MDSFFIANPSRSTVTVPLGDTIELLTNTLRFNDLPHNTEVELASNIVVVDELNTKIWICSSAGVQ